MTQEKSKIKVVDVIGSSVAVSTEKGETLFKKMSEDLEKGNHVTLSFEDVSHLVTAFVNASIGQLYSKFPPDFIRDHMSVEDASEDAFYMIKRVTNNAKEYFANPLFEESQLATV